MREVWGCIEKLKGWATGRVALKIDEIDTFSNEIIEIICVRPR
jgi:hypothetical protein